ncbi:MAG: cyanophycin synthetase, partial [Lysobacterales bacterium]
TPLGEAPLRLPLPGLHNVRNALAAAALAASAGAPLAAIVEGLSQAPVVAGRLVRIALTSGAQLIDDSYNANPGSTAAAIELLARSSGERWLVLGDMRELGTQAATLHRECGAHARAAGIERLFAVGELASEAAVAFGLGGHAFEDQAALIDALRSAMHPDALILVKGSRGSSMERVVLALTRDAAREVGEHVA